MLSRIPALTPGRELSQGEAYEYGAAFAAAAEEVLGPELAALVRRHLQALQESASTGWARQGGAARASATPPSTIPAPREIVAFLDGEYRYIAPAHELVSAASL